MEIRITPAWNRSSSVPGAATVVLAVRGDGSAARSGERGRRTGAGADLAGARRTPPHSCGTRRSLVYDVPMTSTSERAPDPRPARTRAAIFTAARELSAADGEVTVNALAKRAGVSRAAFYSHFTGLDALMAAMLQDMFDAAWARGRAAHADGATIETHVRHGFSMLVAYVERHHAFLRGALDWKSSHRTYMLLTGMLAELHVEALRRIPEGVPSRPGREALARSISGAELAHVEQWLIDTEQAAKDGEQLDATELLETVLVSAPSWYTGIGPEDPTGAAELLAAAREYSGRASAEG